MLLLLVRIKWTAYFKLMTGCSIRARVFISYCDLGFANKRSPAIIKYNPFLAFRISSLSSTSQPAMFCIIQSVIALTH